MLYQRLVELESEEAGGIIAEEIEDRFGRIPQEVSILLEHMVLRVLLKAAKVTALQYRNDELKINFHESVEFEGDQLFNLVKQGVEGCRMSPQKAMSLQIEKPNSPGELGAYLKHLFGFLGLIDQFLPFPPEKPD